MPASFSPVRPVPEQLSVTLLVHLPDREEPWKRFAPAPLAPPGDDPNRRGGSAPRSRRGASYQDSQALRLDVSVALLHLQRTFEETNGTTRSWRSKTSASNRIASPHTRRSSVRVHVRLPARITRCRISKKLARSSGLCHAVADPEKMTAQIANTLRRGLQPKGGAVIIDAAQPMHERRAACISPGDHGNQPMPAAFSRRPAQPARSFSMIGTPGGAKPTTFDRDSPPRHVPPPACPEAH